MQIQLKKQGCTGNPDAIVSSFLIPENAWLLTSGISGKRMVKGKEDVGTLCAFYVCCTISPGYTPSHTCAYRSKASRDLQVKRTSFKRTVTTFSDKVQMLIQRQNQYLQHPWPGALCSPLTMPASPKFWFSTTQFTPLWIFKVITWYFIFSLVHLFNLFLLKHPKLRGLERHAWGWYY